MNIIQEYIDFVESRGDTLLRIIGQTEILLTESLTTKIKEQMSLELNASQIKCLQSLCLSMGTSQNELSQKIGVTKQAMNQIINALEEKQLVNRKTDDTDSRKKIIRHTSKGIELISLILKITKETEDQFIKLLGKKNTRDLKASLEKINEQL